MNRRFQYPGHSPQDVKVIRCYSTLIVRMCPRRKGSRFLMMQWVSLRKLINTPNSSSETHYVYDNEIVRYSVSNRVSAIWVDSMLGRIIKIIILKV